jgi:hypothetical protein
MPLLKIRSWRGWSVIVAVDHPASNGSHLVARSGRGMSSRDAARNKLARKRRCAVITALAVALLVMICLLGYELAYSFYLKAADQAEIEERLRQVTN